MAWVAAVAVDKATPQFDREYSYLVPDGLRYQVGCGSQFPLVGETAAGWGWYSLCKRPRIPPGSRGSPHWWTASRFWERNSSA